MIRYTEFVYRGDGVHFLSGFARRHIGPSKRVRSVNSGWYFPPRTQQFIMRYMLHCTPVWPLWPLTKKFISVFTLLITFFLWKLNLHRLTPSFHFTLCILGLHMLLWKQNEPKSQYQYIETWQKYIYVIEHKSFER